MMRKHFPLTSDQLELLIAFASSGGLAHLSEVMAKDPSVVSRNLQRMAEVLPVIEKQSGRWQMTPLGISLNLLTKKYLDDWTEVRREASFSKPEPCFSQTAVLLIINAQNALSDPALGNRSNRAAENNIQKLLREFRRTQRLVMHIKHVSQNPESPFFAGSEGAQFISFLAPQAGEPIIEKTKSSSFTETTLSHQLLELNADTLILAGFTANDCIDATARQSSDLGFTTYVVGDATAMFDIQSPDGKLYRADRIQRLTLANLNTLYAKVIDVEFLLRKP